MRVLRVHNHYQLHGGEDAVFEAEVRLLQSRGVDVETLVVSNEAISSRRSLIAAADLAVSTVWSREGRHRVSAAVARHRPDVVHFDNTFPRISPAAYAAARSAGAAVVQTLHNYRLLCPSALLFRDGHPCDDCVGHALAWPGVVHACYRNSRAQTAAVAAMLAAHRLRGTWHQDVDRYIALTDFARRMFIRSGLPEDRIVVKPNFVDVPAPQVVHRADHFLFIGRLSAEKGIDTLLAAQHLHRHRLRIAGDGPLFDLVRLAATTDPSLAALGRLAPAQVQEQMLQARALVLPSEWYEAFPVTIAEAFANGLPVIASRLGGMAEIVQNHVTGLLFTPGSADDLARAITWAAEHPRAMEAMGHRAREVYEETYAPDRNFQMLVDIYGEAILSGTRASGPRFPTSPGSPSGDLGQGID